jgi:hypothetical protein
VGLSTSVPAYQRFTSSDDNAPIPMSPTGGPRQPLASKLLELRAAIDDAALRGDRARPALEEVVSRFPADQHWPEFVLARPLLP